jgi:cytochrome c biogenesis protein CcdA/glutaredoxin
MPLRSRRPWLSLLGWLFLLPGEVLAAGQGATQELHAPAVVHITVFASPECEQCQYVEENVLSKLKSKYGPSLAVQTIDVDEGDHYDLLESLERQVGDTDNDLPVIFCGGSVLGGREEVEEGLDALIAERLRAGGAAPIELDVVGEEIPRSSQASVSVAYLRQGGCQKCGRVERMLSALQRRAPHVTVQWFDLSLPENKVLAEAMGRYAGLSEERRLVAPSIFVGQDALVGQEIGEAALRALVEKYSVSGARPIWEIVAGDTSSAVHSIVERFRGLGLFTVMLAGLIDGINPCAFATIVFLLSYLAFMGRTRREVLMAGLAFTVAVAITYFSMGLGLFQFLRRLTFLSLLSRVVYALATVMVLTLSALSFYDFTLIRRGRQPADMKLQLPLFLKRRIHAAIRRQSKSGRLAIGAFLTGVVVSVLELACTGQVYLPTIVFVTGIEGLKAHAILYLLIYNVLFVLPLVIIFMVSYLGVSSRQIGAAMERHMDRVKLILGFLFLLLGVLLLFIFLN